MVLAFWPRAVRESDRLGASNIRFCSNPLGSDVRGVWLARRWERSPDAQACQAGLLLLPLLVLSTVGSSLLLAQEVPQSTGREPRSLARPAQSSQGAPSAYAPTGLPNSSPSAEAERPVRRIAKPVQPQKPETPTQTTAQRSQPKTQQGIPVAPPQPETPPEAEQPAAESSGLTGPTPSPEELRPLLPEDMAPNMADTRLRPHRSWPILLSAGLVMLFLTILATIAVLRTDRPQR